MTPRTTLECYLNLLGTESIEGPKFWFSIEGVWCEGRFDFDSATGELDHSRTKFQALWVLWPRQIAALIQRVADDEGEPVTTENLTRADMQREAAE